MGPHLNSKQMVSFSSRKGQRKKEIKQMITNRVDQGMLKAQTDTMIDTLNEERDKSRKDTCIAIKNQDHQLAMISANKHQRTKKILENLHKNSSQAEAQLQFNNVQLLNLHAHQVSNKILGQAADQIKKSDLDQMAKEGQLQQENLDMFNEQIESMQDTQLAGTTDYNESLTFIKEIAAESNLQDSLQLMQAGFENNKVSETDTKKTKRNEFDRPAERIPIDFSPIVSIMHSLLSLINFWYINEFKILE